DPEAWQQEYECAFIDGSSVLLPLDLIQRCESTDCTEASSVEELSRLTGSLYMGVDFGRSHHRTVCWIFEKVLGPKPGPGLPPRPLFITREVLVLDNMPTPGQYALLAPRAHLAARVCLDYTGCGIGLGDMLFADFGSRIDLCNFTPGFKEELFPRL